MPLSLARRRRLLAAAVLLALARLMLLAGSPLRLVEQRFIADKFVAILLQDGAGERPPADHEDDLVVLLQLVDQRDEIAVAADDGERVDVIVPERHLPSVQRP